MVRGHMSDWWAVAPGWIATIAIAIAVMQFRADRIRRRADLERESREQATRLAVWVLVGAGEEAARGILLQNASGGLFHDIVVEVAWKSSRVPHLCLALLPPGEFVVPLHQTTARGVWGWGDPRPVEQMPSLKPKFKTGHYQVTSVRFSDRLARSWNLDGRGVLSSASRAR